MEEGRGGAGMPVIFFPIKGIKNNLLQPGCKCLKLNISSNLSINCKFLATARIFDSEEIMKKKGNFIFLKQLIVDLPLMRKIIK